MKKINCLIVDDEPLARDVLSEFVSKIESLNLVCSCGNAIEAFNKLEEGHIDLIFLDIRMPKLSGIDLIKNLANPPGVIFTTAYSDYALEGYELEVVDYLLKPISFERFLKAIHRFNKISNVTDNEPSPNDDLSDYSEAFVYLKSDKKMVKVFLKDIIYVESLRNNSRIVTTIREIISSASISELEEKLPALKFLRIHRSFIVALDKISAFNASHIELGKHELPIGRLYKNDVADRLMKE
ncbi:MAG: DNA-binding response regulator [Melioribacteraceae bacterium]|nr:MAG: DNA-binding response regulator [Melioribacteraceae bacterium]